MKSDRQRETTRRIGFGPENGENRSPSMRRGVGDIAACRDSKQLRIAVRELFRESQRLDFTFRLGRPCRCELRCVWTKQSTRFQYRFNRDFCKIILDFGDGAISTNVAAYEGVAVWNR